MRARGKRGSIERTSASHADGGGGRANEREQLPGRMGAKRERRTRSTTAAAILILLSACNCSAAIYRISSDEIIDDDDGPAEIEPSWRWPEREQTQTKSRQSAYPNRVPPWAAQASHEFPDGWKTALQRAAYQSLRHEAGILLGYPSFTPSIQANIYQELWYRLSTAEFVGMNEYRDYDEEDLQSDISTLAEGLLIHKDGELQFHIIRRNTPCDCEGARTLATWSIRRLRHSGPGRGRPQYQLHFSVIPVVEEQSIDLVPVRVEPVRHSPSPKYRGIPIFARNGQKQYNPHFIAEYGRVISAYLQHRDTLTKHQPVQDKRDMVRNQLRQRFPNYETIEPLTEEYDEHYSDSYPKHRPQQETSEEYHENYRGRQQNSRSQYQHYYRERYLSYQTPQEVKGQYHHHYTDQSTPFTSFHQPTPAVKVIRPSPQFERYSETDPLFVDDQSEDHKTISHVISTEHQEEPRVSLITTQTIPTLNLYEHEWQQDDKKTVDSLFKSEIIKESNHSTKHYYEDWTKRAASAKLQVGRNEVKYPPVISSSQLPRQDDYHQSRFRHVFSRNPETLEESPDAYPIGSQSLATIVSAAEAQSDNSNSKRSTPKQISIPERGKMVTSRKSSVETSNKST